MNQVLKQITTFEQIADALCYFRYWRTLFGLLGLCKLPWNDVVPADNAQQAEPAKVPEHVEDYRLFYNAVTGRNLSVNDLLTMSERIYTLQRVFNLYMGRGLRSDDRLPYRAMGPVTPEEYLAHEAEYDQELREAGKTIGAWSIYQKMAELRNVKEARYDGLVSTVYARSGWANDGVPTLAKLAELGILDLPKVRETVAPYLPREEGE